MPEAAHGQAPDGHGQRAGLEQHDILLAPPGAAEDSPPPCSPPSSALATLEEPCYPGHFASGSLIQLSGGDLKHVETLNAEDFLQSAKKSPEVQIDHSTVLAVVPKGGSSQDDHSQEAELRFSVGRQKVHVSTTTTTLSICLKLLPLQLPYQFV